jgi:hypothetical protein
VSLGPRCWLKDDWEECADTKDEREARESMEVWRERSGRTVEEDEAEEWAGGGGG